MCQRNIRGVHVYFRVHPLTTRIYQNPETGKHKGYGFIEFEEPKSATAAIEHMNGFDLCGRCLKVGRAHSGGAPKIGGGGPFVPGPSSANSDLSTALQAARTAAANLVIPNNPLGKMNENSLSTNLTISGAQRFEIMKKLARRPVSVLVLLVVFSTFVFLMVAVDAYLYSNRVLLFLETWYHWTTLMILYMVK